MSNPAGNYWPFRVSLCGMLQELLYSPRSNVPKIIRKKKKERKKERNHSLRGVQFSSVAHSYQHLCYPTSHSKPGLPVHHQLPWVWEWNHPAISSSEVPFSSCPQSFPVSGCFQLSQLLTSGAKVLELQLQHQSFQWIFRTCFFYNGLVGSPCSPRHSQESSLTPQFKRGFGA